MSQVIKSLMSGPVPPAVPTSFVTQDGTAVPAANVLIVNGFDSTENNNNGIITKGGVVGTGTSNEVDVVITNRVQGTATTTGVATATIVTFTPTVIGVYAIEYRLAAFNTTATLGSGASVFGAIRFDGVNSNICDLFDEISNDEGAMSAIDIAVSTTGANVLLQGTGYQVLGVDQVINWGAVGLYTFVGA